MANTTNFGWETPDDTDLVKDGAAAMRTLGNAIDASLVDLKGGTTGQILSKASNTDLDYTWINNDQGDITEVAAGTGITVTNGTGPVPTVALSTPVSATNGGTAQTTYTTGDLLFASATNTLSKRAIGTTGQILTVSGGVPTWAAAPASGSLTLINTGGTTLTGASVSFNSIPQTYRHLQLVIRNYIPANDTATLRMRFNNDTNTSRYIDNLTGDQSNVAFSGSDNFIRVVRSPDNAVSSGLAIVNIFDYANTATWTLCSVCSITQNASTNANLNSFNFTAAYNQTAAIDRIDLIPESGNFTSGTAFLYGVN